MTWRFESVTRTSASRVWTESFSAQVSSSQHISVESLCVWFLSCLAGGKILTFGINPGVDYFGQGLPN